MEKSKKAAFVRRMGKKKLKPVKRQYFDFGGAIGGMLGLGGGAGGSGFSPNPGASPEQLNTAYNQAQDSLKNQNDLAATLNPQVAAGVKAQDVLSGQYADRAAGRGPNVAQTMLNRETGRNVANQAALMAGQRGAGANPALIARLAAKQGAATQQDAAAAAAQLQAEQEIAAQKAQEQLSANRIGQGTGAQQAATTAIQNEQGILEGANTANNQIQGQLANTRIGQQPSALSGLGSAIMPALSQLGDAFAGMGSAVGGGLLAGGAQALPAVGGAAETVAPVMVANKGGEVPMEHHAKKLDFVHKMTKLGLEHHGAGMPMMADGGYVPGSDYVPPSRRKASPSPSPAPADSDKSKEVQDSFNNSVGIDSVKTALGFADGGSIDVPDVKNPEIPVMPTATNMEPTINMASAPAAPSGSSGGGMDMGSLMSMGSSIMSFFDEGGDVPSGGSSVKAMVSPGEEYLKPQQVKEVLESGLDPKSVGEKIPGKAKVKGDSLKNDTVKKDLEPGGVVIDREHMSSADKRRKFVQKAVAKKRAKR